MLYSSPSICNGILKTFYTIRHVVPENIRKFEISLSMEGYMTGDILCISKKYMKFGTGHKPCHVQKISTAASPVQWIIFGMHYSFPVLFLLQET